LTSPNLRTFLLPHVGSPMVDVEWLVLCRGCPARHGWTHQTRVDALSRSVRAALADGSPCHLLFEDCTLLSLAPSFLGEGQPWGPALEASEKRFHVLLEQLRDGAEMSGARWHVPRPRHAVLREVLHGPASAPRFGLVLVFRESGRLLLEPAMAAQDARAVPSTRSLPRTLCVIGGVRDAFPGEERALEDTCPELWARRCTVSLGIVPELTSKCMKVIGALHRGRLLDEAIHRCMAGGCRPHGLQAVTMPGTRGALSQRPPLHIIIKAPTTLSEIVSRPIAATLVVDVFRASCDSHKRTLLSFIGIEGDALTIQQPGKCFVESDALDDLQRQLSCRRRADLKKVLLDGLRILHCPDGRQLRVLHADETAPPLAPQAGLPVLAGLPAAVAVVFGSSTDAISVCAACATLGVRAYARAAVGGLLLGPAYVGILHSARLLAPAISSPLPATPPECPTVRRAPRPAAPARAGLAAGVNGARKAGARPASWAQVVLGETEEAAEKSMLLSEVRDLPEPEAGSAAPTGTPTDMSPVPSTQAPSECSEQVEDWEDRAMEIPADAVPAHLASSAATNARLAARARPAACTVAAQVPPRRAPAADVEPRAAAAPVPLVAEDYPSGVAGADPLAGAAPVSLAAAVPEFLAAVVPEAPPRYTSAPLAAADPEHQAAAASGLLVVTAPSAGIGQQEEGAEVMMKWESTNLQNVVARPPLEPDSTSMTFQEDTNTVDVNSQVCAGPEEPEPLEPCAHKAVQVSHAPADPALEVAPPTWTLTRTLAGDEAARERPHVPRSWAEVAKAATAPAGEALAIEWMVGTARVATIPPWRKNKLLQLRAAP